ncbi:ABC transporter substrate-binding protein [Opitutus sp. ER46]|uniref:ABC transporter substrate-binding protein n=1 Tax=Opitutus sp. ER46 TaxID=2161864 RepID=UPI001E48D788|nr:ABC transporter substrate-binding protein [Opitutus sp. ER46]
MPGPLRLLALALLVSGPLAAPAAEPIKLGEYASLTGKEATFGQSAHRGVVMAVEELNAAGGILGRRLELVAEDDQSKPGEAATIVKKLISRDKVIAVIGEVASSRSLEGAAVCQAARIPMISPASTAPEVTARGDYIFRACFIDPFQGTIMARFAQHTLHAKRVGIMSSITSAESVGLSRYFREQFARDGGTVALEQRYADGDKDFRAQLTAVRAAGVDALFIPGYYVEAALICKQARALGLQIPLFGIDGWESPELVRLGGAAVEGAYFATHFSPEDSAAAVVSFNTRFQKRWGVGSDTLAGLGYDSVMMLADALQRAGTTDAPKLRDALAATKDLVGVTGTITLDAQRNPTKSAVVLQVRGGKFHFIETITP